MTFSAGSAGKLVQGLKQHKTICFFNQKYLHLTSSFTGKIITMYLLYFKLGFAYGAFG
jgi:hypothetical protein